MATEIDGIPREIINEIGDENLEFEGDYRMFTLSHRVVELRVYFNDNDDDQVKNKTDLTAINKTASLILTRQTFILSTVDGHSTGV